MRIALVGPTYPFRGGIAHHTTLLANTLQKKHDLLFVSFKRQYPALLFPGKSDKDPSVNGPRANGVTYLLDSLNPATWLATAQRITAFSPDLLVLPWWVVYWAPIWLMLMWRYRRKAGARIVIICHNVIEHEASAWKRTLTRQVFSRADMLITQSKVEKQRLFELINCIDCSNIHIVQGFHPTYEAFSKSIPNQDAAQKVLGLRSPVLLFFGFVRPYKGLDVLLEAMPAIVAQRGASLLVAGEFWKDKDRYLKQIDRLNISDYVQIVDSYIPNDAVGTYFAAADLVVQPYRTVTGSGVTQLAYGFRKPVVATRIGGLNEIIEHGKNGMLVPPGDPCALAKAVIDGLGQPMLSTLTEQAEKTHDLFSWERFAELIVRREH